MPDDTKCWQRNEATGNLIHCWWEDKNSDFGKHSDGFL